jgi:hypothetical protein
MRKRKLSTDEVAELRAAYEAWNPHERSAGSASDLAARFGISKQTLYTLRNEWIEQDRRAAEPPPPIDPAVAGVICYLTEQLLKTRQELEKAEFRCEVFRTRRMTAEL